MISHSRMTGLEARIATLGATVVLLFSANLAMAQDGVSQDPELAASNPAGSASVSQIQEHGTWTIQVLDPDGTIVTEREAHNSLTGGPFLSQLLAGNATVAGWELQASGGFDGPCAPPQVALPCAVEQANAPDPSYPPGDIHNEVFTTLTTSAPTFGQPNNGSFVLSGSFVAPHSGVVSAIEILEEVNGLSGFEGFSVAFVNPSVNVSAGQTVNLVAVISFS